MNDSAETPPDQLIDWARRQLDRAVNDLQQSGAFASSLIEVKPVWTFPRSLVIGKIREQGEADRYYWVIVGDHPADYLSSLAATTPREAARHFAMRWQLDAARRRDPKFRQELDADSLRKLDAMCQSLEHRAQSLYELVEKDSLWSPTIP